MTAPDITSATVEQYGAYHLITFGSWQVTVDNVGMIKLPALCTPDTVDDLIGALVAAQPVGRQQQEDNAVAQRQVNDFFAAQRAASQERETAVRAQAAPEKTAVRKNATPAEKARRTASKVGGPRGARKPPEPRKPIKKAVPAPKKAAAAKAEPPAPAKKAAPVKRTRSAQKRTSG